MSTQLDTEVLRAFDRLVRSMMRLGRTDLAEGALALLNGGGPLELKAPKSGADRQREYRARKRDSVTPTVTKSVTETVTESDVTERNAGSSPSHSPSSFPVLSGSGSSESSLTLSSPIEGSDLEGAAPEPVTAEERYAHAFARGVTAVTANPCSAPATRDARGCINRATVTHFKGLRGDALTKAIEESASAYARAKPSDARFGGFAPKRWLAWLDSGKPSEAATKPGLQPHDPNAEWAKDDHGRW